VGISRRDEEGRSGKRRRDNNNEFVKNTGTSPSIHSTRFIIIKRVTWD